MFLLFLNRKEYFPIDNAENKYTITIFFIKFCFCDLDNEISKSTHFPADQ